MNEEEHGVAQFLMMRILNIDYINQKAVFSPDG